MIGTREIQPPDAKVPRLGGRCTIKIGPAIDTDRYRDRADAHMVLRQITDELMFEIRELTGQQYVNHYAGKTAETEPTIVAPVATIQPLEAVELLGT